MENSATFKELLTTSHAPVSAVFNKSASDFVVREVPLYEFSGSGEHVVVEIEKKGLTTKEALQILSETSGIKLRDFGYAGLKDKEGLTSQFVSYPAKFDFGDVVHPNLKILQKTRHNNKIRTGHLKANRFFLRLKKVSKVEAERLKGVVSLVGGRGFANYFGYQRFGKFGDNFEEGVKILRGEKRANPKMSDFFISAFQSRLFNEWLSKRVEMSKFAETFSERELCEIYGFSRETAKNVKSQRQFFRLFEGDVLGHYPHGRLFLCEDLCAEVARFAAAQTSVMGLLPGKKAFEASGEAMRFEREFYGRADDFLAKMNGTRRFAWVWAEDVVAKYDEENAHFTISFALQKGCYATVFLREILGREIFFSE